MRPRGLKVLLLGAAAGRDDPRSGAVPGWFRLDVELFPMENQIHHENRNYWRQWDDWTRGH